MARLIKQYDYPMVLNVVLHRQNIDAIQHILDMAEELEADYVELANTQYYGWALRNRAQLLPTRAQVERAESHCACVPGAFQGTPTHSLCGAGLLREPPQALPGGLGCGVSGHCP